MTFAGYLPDVHLAKKQQAKFQQVPVFSFAGLLPDAHPAMIRQIVQNSAHVLLKAQPESTLK